MEGNENFSMENSVKALFSATEDIERISEKVKKSKAIRIHKMIMEGTYTNSTCFCRNERLLYKIYSALLSQSKKYIIIFGCGGFGKTTAINAIMRCDGLSKENLQFSNIVNRRNFYKWTRLRTELLSGGDNNVFVVDNFRALEKKDLDYISNTLNDPNLYNKVILICRNNSIQCHSNSCYSLIDCNKYPYKTKILRELFTDSLTEQEKKVLPKSDFDNMLKNIKRLPPFAKNPFFVRLMAWSLVWNSTNGRLNEVFSNLNYLLTGDNAKNQDLFCYLLIENLMGFNSDETTHTLKGLIYLDLIVNETTFEKSELERIIQDTSIVSDSKEFCERFEIFTLLNGKHYIHSIYADFFDYKFMQYSISQKCSFFNDPVFKTVIKNISHLLDMGKANPYSDGIKYLPYAHNIWNFCHKYLCGIENVEIFKGLDIDIQKAFVDLLNSYSLMLVKTYDNTCELFEAESVQNDVIDLIQLISPQDYADDSDLYFSTLTRYYNVNAKILLAFAVDTTSSEGDKRNSYFEAAENNLNLFEKSLGKINDEQNYLCRKEVLHYTTALKFYKKALYNTGNGRDQEISEALNQIKQSEQKSIEEMLTCAIPKSIVPIQTVVQCLKNYDSEELARIQQILFEKRSLNPVKTLTGKINAHIATLELKCIILCFRYYIIKQENAEDLCLMELYNEIKKTIDFTFSALTDDIMRQRELLVLKIDFERVSGDVEACLNTLEKLFGDRYKLIGKDDNRLKLMKNIILLLCGVEDKLDFQEIAECCLAYSIDKSLFSDHDIGRRQTAELLLYKYLTI